MIIGRKCFGKGDLIVGNDEHGNGGEKFAHSTLHADHLVFTTDLLNLIMVYFI